MGEHDQYILQSRALGSSHGPISTGFEHVLCLNPRHPHEKCHGGDAVFWQIVTNTSQEGPYVSNELQHSCMQPIAEDDMETQKTRKTYSFR